MRLLPYFDAYVVGSHPREVVFPGRAYERALSGGQAGNFPVVLVDGHPTVFVAVAQGTEEPPKFIVLRYDGGDDGGDDDGGGGDDDGGN